jgi:hypothetical protein
MGEDYDQQQKERELELFNCYKKGTNLYNLNLQINAHSTINMIYTNYAIKSRFNNLNKFN